MTMLNRREAINLGFSAAATGVATASLSLGHRRLPVDRSSRTTTIDTNVSLFHWPFHRLPLDDAGALVKKLDTLGIAQAWAGSFEGVLHRDIAGVNRRLAEECEKHAELIAIGSINPELPDWEEDLRICIDVHQMPGIRLHPNYHGYRLDDPRAARLIERTTTQGAFVQIAAAIEDTRTQHPMFNVPDVDIAPLTELIPRIDGARVQILNYRPDARLIDALARTRGLFLDTARIEGTDGIPELIKRVAADRVMFGTHAPFLVPDASLIRVHESGRLEAETLQSVLANNAHSFLNRQRR